VPLAASSTAWAAEGTSSLGIAFLSEVMVLILVGLILAEAMRRLGQPAVMGPLIGGLLLGPSVLGALWPSAQHALLASEPAQKDAINAFAQFGVLLLLLLAGMETELRLLQRIGYTAVAVSIAGITLPFIFGFSLGEFLPASLLPHPEHRLVSSLFISTALSISSVKIVAMVVREMNFSRRNVGAVILAAAVIDDTIGWMILAVIFSLANRGTLDAGSIFESTLGTLLFLGLSMLVGRRLVPRLIRWANDILTSEGSVIAVILLLMGGMALITHWIGVHTVLGAFVAGMLVGESPMLTVEIDRQLRGIISALVVPVFFGLAGLNADLTMLRDPTLLGLTGLLILIASVGKFAGAFLGGRLGGMTTRESLALACGMNARGSTEVIVATVGLSIGILSQQLFTMIVAMAVVTTLAMPPMLRWALRQLPLSRDERARIDRERFHERGFIANIERLLLAVDESPNGQFAARLVGLIAGFRGIPVTVLHIGPKSERPSDAEQSGPEKAVEAAAAVARASAEADRYESGSPPVDISTRIGEGGLTASVADEAKKGYGLLAIGVSKVTTKQDFHDRITRAVAGFEGPLMIVRAQGPHLEDPINSKFRIVLPVTGTEVSRRAAEVAVAMAKASGAPIVAVYASSAGDSKTRRRRGGATRAHEDAILQDFLALARRYGVEAETVVRTDSDPDEAILGTVQGSHDLIVMGANRRAGTPLYLGEVAASVLQTSKVSVVLVTN
jgi:Kef-type K+ transport system membrane component KefB/nucleotide-binding universal stress UspA family protein